MAVWAHQFMDHPCVSVETCHPENKQRNALRGNWGLGKGTAKLQRGSSHICAFTCAFLPCRRLLVHPRASPHTSELGSSRARGRATLPAATCARTEGARVLRGGPGSDGSAPGRIRPQLQAAAGEARRSRGAGMEVVSETWALPKTWGLPPPPAPVQTAD